METKKCTMCGNELDEFDTELNFSIHKKIGYGSIHDGDKLDLDLCCECFDKLMSVLRPMCGKDPIK